VRSEDPYADAREPETALPEERSVVEIESHHSSWASSGATTTTSGSKLEPQSSPKFTPHIHESGPLCCAASIIMDRSHALVLLEVQGGVKSVADVIILDERVTKNAHDQSGNQQGCHFQWQCSLGM